jgi:hypothetical protein
MPKSRKDQPRTLAESWTAPAASPVGDVGSPLICLASTFTFHASFLESDLLPRFLGLKYDESEGTRPFIVEREQALAMIRVSILVNADHLDPSQTTLRWDQLPVRVPDGAQHSKIVLLVWENYARLVVSSANLTRSGYRRNREIAGVLDFFDHESSAPRQLALDALDFLRQVTLMIQASEPARMRFEESLESARTRFRAWRNMPADFAPRERPRVTFVGGLPRRNGAALRSPLQQAIELWGSRRASEIIVVTPFVGDIAGVRDPVIDKMLELPRARDANGYLVVPGRPSVDEINRMVVALPARFRDAWATAWRVKPDDVTTYVVPPCRVGEKVNRELHAKALLVSGEGTTMLLCGSSNFSPRGMGVGVSNVEANLCYFDDQQTRHNGLTLENRLPVDWDNDLCEAPIWPIESDPLEEEPPTSDRPLPAAFLWALYNQKANSLIVALDLSATLPPEWSLYLPGEGSGDSPPLFDRRYEPWPPANARMVMILPAALFGASISGLRLVWCEEDGSKGRAVLPVHVEHMDDLLPPEEFRSLTTQGILDCLLSGRAPAEWVDAIEKRQASDPNGSIAHEFDSLRAVDTSSYLLYRTRRLGIALTALGDRLFKTARSNSAMHYRLRQDPLGPLMLAASLVRESEGAQMHDPVNVMFSLAELNLMLAHVACRMTEAPLRHLFGGAIAEIEEMCRKLAVSHAPPANLQRYLREVGRKQAELLDQTNRGVHRRV